MDCAKALREMNGKYLQSRYVLNLIANALFSSYAYSRPMKITKSSWKERDLKEVRKNEKKKEKMYADLGLR